jgi:phosphoribosylanthranilate isomerase
MLPPFIARVGVFVNAPAALVEETAAYCGLDTLQLHGEETPEYCRYLKYKIIKAFRVRNESTLEQAKGYDVGAVLLDTYVSGTAGGTGRCFDWRVARELAAVRRVILAGGLRPDNVGLAVETARPYAVDVSSGVETSGQKDPEKIRPFIQAAGRGCWN